MIHPTLPPRKNLLAWANSFGRVVCGVEVVRGRFLGNSEPKHPQFYIRWGWYGDLPQIFISRWISFGVFNIYLTIVLCWPCDLISFYFNSYFDSLCYIWVCCNWQKQPWQCSILPQLNLGSWFLGNFYLFDCFIPSCCWPSSHCLVVCLHVVLFCEQPVEYRLHI